ncbi:MAG: elongation factor P [Planctomycetota bacterium]|jgi:elongation factor P|nr:elongation factor P [Planctomycetota bacterium]MDP6763685.1 elongation factor P [Planctomycetota bacterium]MDP6989482.1 elongation factor P [Planctomycetota bacterium]
MSVRATELRKGSVIDHQGDLLKITEYHHSTPGNWRAIIQMKTRSLTTGQAGSIRAGSGDTFEIAFLERRKCEYLYREGNGDCVFMDGESYEQFPLPASLAEDSMGYIKENTTVELTFHDGRAIGIDLPPTVELAVTEAEAAVKGNTATNVKKDAVVETGLGVKVPMHISVGDLIRINTDTGEFQGRCT